MPVSANVSAGFLVDRRLRIPVDPLCYAMVGLLAIMLRWPFFGHPAADCDEQIYQLIGERMLDGALPYIDIWDRKPIGLFLIFALANLIGGAGPLPYQILACVAAVGGGMLVYHLAKRFTDGMGALVAGMLYVLYLSVFEGRIGQTEVFFVPLLIAMASLTVRMFQTVDSDAVHRLGLFAMALGGVTLQIKYTALPQCILFGVLALARQVHLGIRPSVLATRCVIYGAAGLLPTGIAISIYTYIGHVDAYIYANFLSIFSRGVVDQAVTDNYLFHIIARSTPLFLAALVGVVNYISRVGRNTPLYLVIVGWTASAVTGSVMIGNFYIHYFSPIVPGLIILAAPALSRTWAGATLSALCLYSGFFLLAQEDRTAMAREDWQGYDKMLRAVAPYVAPERGECLYIFDGPTSLYRDTHSCLPTIYAYPDHLSNSVEVRSIGVDTSAEMARILKTRPAVIITASEHIVPSYNKATAAQVDRAVAQAYVRVGSYTNMRRMLYVNVRQDLLRAERPASPDSLVRRTSSSGAPDVRQARAGETTATYRKRVLAGRFALS